MGEQFSTLATTAKQNSDDDLTPEALEARDSLAAFVRLAWDEMEPGTPLVWNWHIDAICAHLEAVAADQLRRLLINVPPGHMKSLIVSVFWPAWVWLKRPEWRMLCAAYGMDLAIRDAEKCRELVESDFYLDTFKPSWSISKSSRAKSSYKNSQKGSRIAVSVGGKTTGFRGDVVTIDDPLNVLDAYSDTKRAKAIRWLDQAASNRLADPRKGAIVMIMQRLHHDDPSGHVLRQKRPKYQHLCLPSYFEPERAYHTSLAESDNPEWAKWGRDIRTQPRQILFPGFFTEEVLIEEEERMQQLVFEGQHQQRPTPAAGNIFRAEYFCMDARETHPEYKPDPDNEITQFKFWPFPTSPVTEAYQAYDTALKDKTQNDFSAGCTSMLCEDGYTYLIPHLWRRMEVPKLQVEVAMEWAKWRALLGLKLRGCRIEEGAGTALVQFLRQLTVTMREQDKAPTGFTQEQWDFIISADPIQLLPFPARIGKVERAMGVLPYCAGKSVRIVETAISRDWLLNLLGFPLATNDDPVDSTISAIEPFAGVQRGTPVLTAEQIRKSLALGGTFDADDLDPDDGPDLEYMAKMERQKVA